MKFTSDGSVLVLDAAAEQLTIIDALGREQFLARGEVADERVMNKVYHMNSDTLY